MIGQRLDPLTCALTGQTLVEASAGTGKTYALAALAVRLIVEAGLEVSQILIVTFTEAATDELRGRVRARGRDALVAFSGAPPADAFLAGLVGQTPDPEVARRRLVLALRSFDEAAIYTIHGFCQRVLQEAAFEAGSAFGSELLADPGAGLQEVVDDFWRREFHHAPLALVRAAVGAKLTPASLANLAKRWASRPGLTVRPPPGPPPAQELGRDVEDAFGAFASAWRQGRAEAGALLRDYPGFNRNRVRVSSVDGWLQGLDALVASGDPIGAAEGLAKVRAGFLATATKGGAPPPQHPVFDAAEALAAAQEALAPVLARELASLQGRCLAYVRHTLPRWKADRGVRAFDDLLLDLRAALAGEGGEELARALRGRYRAALIDEFQDTDPVQYEIFHRIFGAEPTRLFLIGDPKQAIYSFRGADVFAYMFAAGQAERRVTLGQNWRSDPTLVGAVNAVFERGPAPFVFADIPFEPVDPAAAGGGREETDLAPLRVWLVEPLEGEAVVSKGEGAARVARAVATEVVRFLAEARAGRLSWRGAPLEPQDVAVLVRSNAQAQEVHRELLGRGVPAVLSATGSLFATQEARELWRVLGAVADPGDERAVRAALATDLLGLTGEALAAVIADDARWDAWVGRLEGYHRRWIERGFAPMARTLLAGEGMRARLLGTLGGERRLTDLLHTVEVLQGAASEGHLGPDGVLSWLGAMLATPSEAEEYQQRLESDERAVQVVTVHKSKGLEYPVTFCPFQWDGVRAPKGAVGCHDPADSRRLLLDLGSDDFAGHAALAAREEFAENVRLLYVALTRAKHHCTVVWGPFRDAGSSALAQVLHPPPGGEAPADPVAATVARFTALGPGGIARDLAVLVEATGGNLEVAPLPPSTSARYTPPDERERPLACRRLSHPVTPGWAAASFSSLTSGREERAEEPDRDAGASGEADGAPGTLFAFPRGTRAGLCLHEVFEEAGGGPLDPAALAALVAAKLARYAYDPAWRDPVAAMVEQVYRSPLGPGGPRLAEVGDRDRVPEFEFYLPLARVTRDGLARVFSAHGGPSLSPDFPERLGRLEFAPTRGVLRGFVDLVFCHGGRYYLADWKSNFLGGRAADYGPEALERAMDEHLYPFQAHLYAAALHGYLRGRVPGYDYDRHFGGTAYVFLRGINGEGAGVHARRPPRVLVEGLHAYLTGGDS